MRCLQRFFSAFPGGWPGVGLLLLRSAAGVVAVIQGSFYLAGSDNVQLSSGIAGAVTMLAGIFLLAGFCTPAAGTLVGLSTVSAAFSWLRAPAGNLFDSILPGVLMGVMAAAIIFLGPGALSVDARLFGRREIIIPPVARSTEP